MTNLSGRFQVFFPPWGQYGILHFLKWLRSGRRIRPQLVITLLAKIHQQAISRFGETLCILATGRLSIAAISTSPRTRLFMSEIKKTWRVIIGHKPIVGKYIATSSPSLGSRNVLPEVNKWPYLPTPSNLKRGMSFQKSFLSGCWDTSTYK